MRYQCLTNNTAQLHALFVLSNLMIGIRRKVHLNAVKMPRDAAAKLTFKPTLCTSEFRYLI